MKLTLCSAPDARAYFFLSCQEEVAKKNARPPRRPAAPGALRCSVATGGCGTRPYGAQTVLAPFSVAPCAARRRRGQEQNRSQFLPPRIVLRRCSGFPLWSAEQRRAAGGSRRALFEGRRPELRSRPAERVAQGSRRSRPRSRGRLFFRYFLLAKQKKVARASGAKHCVSEQENAGKHRPSSVRK